MQRADIKQESRAFRLFKNSINSEKTLEQLLDTACARDKKPLRRIYSSGFCARTAQGSATACKN